MTAGLPRPRLRPLPSVRRGRSASGSSAARVPYLTEELTFAEKDGPTSPDHSGEFGTDFGIVGRWCADRAAAAWEAAVRSSFRSIRTEAERRVTPGTAHS